MLKLGCRGGRTCHRGGLLHVGVQDVPNDLSRKGSFDKRFVRRVSNLCARRATPDGIAIPVGALTCVRIAGPTICNADARQMPQGQKQKWYVEMQVVRCSRLGEVHKSDDDGCNAYVNVAQSRDDTATNIRGSRATHARFYGWVLRDHHNWQVCVCGRFGADGRRQAC